MFRSILRIILITAAIFIASSTQQTTSTLLPANINCTFHIEDGMYTAVLTDQSYKAGQKTRVYGKHHGGNANGNVRRLIASHRNNRFHDIPQVFFRIFTSLERADFENCGLQQLSIETFKYAKNVRHMKFAQDSIKTEAATFSPCQNLEILEFDGNDLLTADIDTFLGLGNLRKLVMNNVNIRSVFTLAQMLRHLKKLEEIHLTNNHLKLFPIAALAPMQNLRIINVSHNDIDMATTPFLKDKPYLEVLDLSHNKIETVEHDFVASVQNHVSINFEGNICVDKHFEGIGSDDNPTIKVANLLKNCTNDQAKIPGTIVTMAPKADSDDESDESVVTTAAPKKLLKDTDILKKLLESERDAADDDDKPHVESMTDSPFEFVKKNNSKIKTPDSVTAMKPKEESESEEEDDDESTTIATTTLITETQTFAAAEGKKKKKKKKKKNQGLTEAEIEGTTAVVEVTQEEIIKKPIETTNSQKTFAEILKEETQTTIQAQTTIQSQSHPEKEKPETFLHDYEQATGRVYHDSDGNYNCVIENATPEVKKFNIIHIGNHTNQDITHIFFINSRFHHVPENLIKTFPNLLHLSIKRTKINAMTHDFFIDCGKVESLDLTGNNLRYIEMHALKHCAKLQLLDVSKNPLETIENGLFDINPSLTVVFNGLKISPAQAKKKVTFEDDDDEKKIAEKKEIIEETKKEQKKIPEIIIPQENEKNPEKIAEKKEMIDEKNEEKKIEATTQSTTIQLIPETTQSTHVGHKNDEKGQAGSKFEEKSKTEPKNDKKPKTENKKDENAQSEPKNDEKPKTADKIIPQNPEKPIDADKNDKKPSDEAKYPEKPAEKVTKDSSEEEEENESVEQTAPSIEVSEKRKEMIAKAKKEHFDAVENPEEITKTPEKKKEQKGENNKSENAKEIEKKEAEKKPVETEKKEVESEEKSEEIDKAPQNTQKKPAETKKTLKNSQKKTAEIEKKSAEEEEKEIQKKPSEIDEKQTEHEKQSVEVQEKSKEIEKKPAENKAGFEKKSIIPTKLPDAKKMESSSGSEEEDEDEESIEEKHIGKIPPKSAINNNKNTGNKLAKDTKEPKDVVDKFKKWFGVRR